MSDFVSNLIKNVRFEFSYAIETTCYTHLYHSYCTVFIDTNFALNRFGSIILDEFGVDRS